jgi:hypothetical protein
MTLLIETWWKLITRYLKTNVPTVMITFCKQTRNNLYKYLTVSSIEYSFTTTHLRHVIRHNARTPTTVEEPPPLAQSNCATEECVSVLSVIALVTRKRIDHGDAQRSDVMKLVLPILRQSHNNPQTNTMLPSLADTSFCSSIIQLTLYKTHTSLH